MKYGLLLAQILIWEGVYMAVCWLLTLPGRHKIQAKYGKGKEGKWKPGWKAMLLIAVLTLLLHIARWKLMAS